MRIASWNINSVRMRQERLLEWLRDRRPDVVCLQEIKALEEQFPSAAFRELGYDSAVFGQKTYNGVAILSRYAMREVGRGLLDGGAEGGAPQESGGETGTGPEARLLAVTVGDLRVHSVYVPNGRTISSESYAHKLRWLGRLGEHLDRLERGRPLLLCGDFNVAPDERDLYNPAAFGQDVIFHQDVRNAFARILGRGLIDTFRLFQEEAGHFSWWDYRMLAFPKNRGLRIDLILASADLVPRVTAAGIDREARKGKLPSDHAPIWVEVSVDEGLLGPQLEPVPMPMPEEPPAEQLDLLAGPKPKKPKPEE
jgi:exodeoxyribonuclease-3